MTPLTSLPNDKVLRWASQATGGTSVVSTESLSRSTHRPSGTFLLTIDGTPTGTTNVILKQCVPRWIGPRMVTTNARALELANTYGLAAPQLIAADLDGIATGTVATLETPVPGSSDVPTTVSVARLREAGAAIARVHAFNLQPQPNLPHRTHPCAVDDRAAERRRGDAPTTPLLEQADQQIMAHKIRAESVFLHGDIWCGNMLWEADRCVALIDWKTAGVGDPGVDLGSLRMQVALRYGQDAPTHVLDGWQHETGCAATEVAHWDAVAALNTDTVTGGTGFAEDGSPLDTAAITERRDTFLRNALDQLQH